MKIGKLPEQVLIRSVLKQVQHRREEVLVGPSVGLDCAAFTVAEDEAVVMSTDPITGTAKDLGHHCIHITANDLAASGAEPIGIMLTVLLPEHVLEEDVKRLMKDAEETCAQLNMEILGGHTEITDVVQNILVTVTGVGKIKKKHLLTHMQAKADQDIVVTKWIGLEGTSILAKEREAELLGRFSPSFVNTAKGFDQYLSVVREGSIAASLGVSAMHDITEGGVFGALWEIASAGGVGLDIDLKAIPIRQETVEVCEFFHANPYQMMSSGSMLIATDDGKALLQALKAEGIHGAVVGRTNSGNDRILRNGEEVRFLDRPQPDELYKALRS
ncbi:MAG: AIR synthase family protein [Lachnospiraceae bacterium]|nr:AIR synthase family protein [Lachnospiraceae bacterium]